MNYLSIYSETVTQRLTLKGPALVVGSAPDADYVLQGPGILPVTLELLWKGSFWEAVAKGHVRRNGEPLAQARLVPGDRLEINDTILLFEVEAEHDDKARIAPQSLRENASHTQVTLSPAEGKGFPLADTLREFAFAAAQEPQLDRLLHLSLEKVMYLLQGTEAFLFTLDNEGQLKADAAIGVSDAKTRFSDSIVQAVIKEGKALFLADASHDPQFGASRSIMDLKLHSVLCAPLLLGGQVKGALYVGSRKLTLAYGAKDAEALQAFAQVLGLIVYHVEFMAQQAERLSLSARSANDEGMIAQSPAMQKALRETDAVAGADISVLILGETGSGKEVLAERLHRRSPRAKGPLVAVNCSALKGELLESELFGYKKGSFTGATQDKQGLFAATRGGTLFLDEIGEMDITLQAKLLRALETGKIRPVGATAEETFDARVIAATHRDLKTLIAEKGFREDLFYRLAPIAITLPPLRDRGDDIILLAVNFLDRYLAKYPAKSLKGFSSQSLQDLRRYAWPGNVRELLNAVHKAVLLSPGPLVDLDLGTGVNVQGDPEFVGFDEATARFQKNYLEQALALAGGARETAAKLLKMSRSTFFRYLSQLGVE